MLSLSLVVLICACQKLKLHSVVYCNIIYDSHAKHSALTHFFLDDSHQSVIFALQRSCTHNTNATNTQVLPARNQHEYVEYKNRYRKGDTGTCLGGQGNGDGVAARVYKAKLSQCRIKDEWRLLSNGLVLN